MSRVTREGAARVAGRAALAQLGSQLAATSPRHGFNQAHFLFSTGRSVRFSIFIYLYFPMCPRQRRGVSLSWRLHPHGMHCRILLWRISVLRMLSSRSLSCMPCCAEHGPMEQKIHAATYPLVLRSRFSENPWSQRLACNSCYDLLNFC